MEKMLDPISHVLIQQAKLEMMNIYKPGMVRELGDSIAEVTIGEEPLRIVAGIGMGKKDFYGRYKIAIPLESTVPIKDANELLLEGIQTKVHLITKQGAKKMEESESILVIYIIDFWVTREGEVWHENAESLWRCLPLKIPEGVLQQSFVNIRGMSRPKTTV